MTKGNAGRLFRPAPSFYDLCIAGFVICPYIKDSAQQKIFFIFYIIFLVCISIGLRPRREYTSIPLMLLSLWSFLGVFVHSYVIPSELSITLRYLNMYLMSEGFIYILFSALFITAVIRYSKSTWFLVLACLVGLWPISRIAWNSGSVTFFCSLTLSVLVYLLFRKRFLLSGVMLLCFGFAVKFNWAWVKMKFFCRPYVWQQLISDIIKHPLFGSGYNKYLTPPDNMMEVAGYGFLYRHNDYLSLGAYLGIFAILCILAFIILSIKKIGIRPALIPFLALAIMPFFQMTFFRVERAGVYMLISALCIKPAVERRPNEKDISCKFS